jgi:hypothetical protein
MNSIVNRAQHRARPASLKASVAARECPHSFTFTRIPANDDCEGYQAALASRFRADREHHVSLGRNRSFDGCHTMSLAEIRPQRHDVDL